jgi:hypothetical protein
MRVRPGDQRIATSQFGREKSGQVGSSFGYLANPQGARRPGCRFPYNPQKVAILPVIQTQSRSSGKIVRNFSRPPPEL